MTEIRINSWNELNDRIFEDSWNDYIERFRSNFAYRGLSTSDYQLKTSLIRLEGPYDKLERHLIRNFRKYAHRDTVARDSIWNWLATAQHYGLPTRLMDWTFSPYVAMHFATCNIDAFHVDGVIWCVDYVKTHKLLPKKLRKYLEEAGSNVFTAEMLSAGANTLEDLKSLSEKPFPMFLEPPSLDDRIVNQYALFSLMSDSVAMFDEWLRKHPELYKRIIIPAEVKWEIRDKLDQANITERVLFPGLEGTSSWLKRLYSPKEKKNLDFMRIPGAINENTA